MNMEVCPITASVYDLHISMLDTSSCETETIHDLASIVLHAIVTQTPQQPDMIQTYRQLQIKADTSGPLHYGKHIIKVQCTGTTKFLRQTLLELTAQISRDVICLT